jgi:hypothetical protein
VRECSVSLKCETQYRLEGFSGVVSSTVYEVPTIWYL